MNVKLILMLGALGALEAAAVLAGLVRTGVEGYVTAAMSIVIGVIAGVSAPRKPFLHGLLAGGLANMVGPLILAAFFDRYLSLNPDAVKSLQALPAGVAPRAVVLVGAPVLGILYGLCVGLLAWIVSKATRRSPKTPALT
jgi:hypothetical protein